MRIITALLLVVSILKYILLLSVINVGGQPINDRCGIDPLTRVNYGQCTTTAYCCSAFGYCGTDNDYCVGCQKDFGYCPFNVMQTHDFVALILCQAS